jgi:hypothetical protein
MTKEFDDVMREFGEGGDGEMQAFTLNRDELRCLGNMTAREARGQKDPLTIAALQLIPSWRQQDFKNKPPLCLHCDHVFTSAAADPAVLFFMLNKNEQAIVSAICDEWAAGGDDAALLQKSGAKYDRTLALGGCYKTSATRLLTMGHPTEGFALRRKLGLRLRDTAGVMLVHGIVSCPRWRSHAWLQFPNGSVWNNAPMTVDDPTQRYSAESWQALATPTVVAKFTREQTEQNFEKLGHWGPWYDESDVPSECLAHLAEVCEETIRDFATPDEKRAS